METIEVGYLEILLVREVLNHMVHELDLFLALTILEVVVLHLIEDKEDSIESDLVNIVQECCSSRQASSHLLLLHNDLEFNEFVFNAFEILK